MARRYIIYLIVSCIVGLFGSHGSLARGRKEIVFDDCWPKRLVFRGEYIGAANADYKSFVNSGILSDGYIQKYVPYDEALRVHPYRTAGFAGKLKRDDPSKIMLLHWDAEEHVNCIPESSQKYFPGHWITYEGSVISEDLKPGENEIFVEDIIPFAKRSKNKKARSEWECPVLMIVALDADGTPDWAQYEYVAIDSIDTEIGKITVRRAFALSEENSFAKGSRISPMPTYVSSEHLFMFNYSVLCPTDEAGHNAVDVQLAEIIELFDENTGRLKDLDGISFDVLNWLPPCDRSRIDSNGDGRADGAMDPVTGEDLWQKGAYEFQKRLREHFGTGFIMLNDSYSRRDQRAMGLFNGLESEGLVRHNDAFRGFSKTINVFTYWKNNNPLKYSLYTVVPKIKNVEDQSRQEQFLRLCVGTATCLGAAINTSPVESVDDIQDELKGGKLNQAHWLGKSVGEMVNLGLCGKDLSGDVISKMRTPSSLFVSGCKMEMQKDSSIRIMVEDNGRYDVKCSFKTVVFHIPDNVDNVVLSFDIKSGMPVKGMLPEVPKIVSVKAEGLPVYEENRQFDNMYNDMWGLCGIEEYSTQSFLYRSVGGKDLSFAFEIEGAGDYYVRNLHLRASNGLIYKEFENGVVIVNPSFGNVAFDLGVFGESKFKRLDGTSSVNDGKSVCGRVEIPGLDSVFLMKSN